jgi:MFS superfamily sulfate permease-like transporter
MSPTPPTPDLPGGKRGVFGTELLASLVVFLVALPLCMGIAIASGVPPALGLITGIIGGLVVGTFSGSPLQVSGPAAGLAVIVWELVQRFGLGALGPILLVAGALQLVAGLLRGGRWFQAVPPSVIHGMLAGIGVLIVSGQFHVMVDDKPRGSGLANILSLPEAVWKGVMPLDGSAHHMAAGLGLLTLGVLLGWNKFAPAKLRLVPGALVAVVVASVVANVLGLPVVFVDVPDSLWGAANKPTLEGFRVLGQPAALGAAVALAIIASAETLLCASAVDRMHDGPRTHYDRELAAQGVGNVLCGLLGALPMTGVIVRSSANVAAGARTRLSAVLHGAWLLGLVVAAPGVLRLVPVASLAAVLVFTGYKLVNLAVVRTLRRFGRAEVGIYLATMTAIVVTDLLTGVLLGLGLALVKLLLAFTRMEVKRVDDAAGNRAMLYLFGSATFLRLPDLTQALASIPDGRHVEVHLAGLRFVDHACIEALGNWERLYRARGGTVALAWDELHARTRPQQLDELVPPTPPMRPQPETQVVRRL